MSKWIKYEMQCKQEKIADVTKSEVEVESEVGNVELEQKSEEDRRWTGAEIRAEIGCFPGKERETHRRDEMKES